ncbi:winged helix DNA-binding domain-containing protein [Kribbella jiaozuonensis]|uniref:Winged helix DNA-binding domain-containing protein n=1 Tax=Kribbella jiaozuonensis TaxID=2575441 RepID=A0A4U3LHX3_9ACTN|nr:winged helix DNA-binding domain-containing protein [Kribbella jiaozuonensis]TKK73667.1 winged helix DNA-binding domain-containing protein [Kribbella jiaozuonensis]
MARIGVDERRARLGRRHRLGADCQAADPVEAAASMVALHATDPATVHLSVAARVPGSDVAGTERALYDDRSLIRMLGMRRTVFVVPTPFAPVVQAACTDDIAVKQRKLLVKHLNEAGVAEDPEACGRWLAAVEESTATALALRGSATAQELSADEPRLRTRLSMAVGKTYAAQPYVTSRVLFQLSAEGRIVRGRPLGTWLSGQHQWSPSADWLPGGLGDRPVAEEARVMLARAWLASFGPGTAADLQWWAGWTGGQTKKALAAVEAVAVDLDGQVGYVLPGDEAPEVPVEPWVAFLPGLDPTPMGWKERDWFLGPHKSKLFDNTGNIGPTIWADGRIIGGWGQPESGEVRYELLEDVGSDTTTLVESEAARWTNWLAGVRVTPRFRSPLEKQLSQG